jgi:hypothetical protein
MIKPTVSHRIVTGIVALATAAIAFAQQPVKPSSDLLRAIRAGVPIDPATNVAAASMPGKLSRRALTALGIKPEELQEDRATTYSATRLEDEKGRLSVFYASLVKEGSRWVFFGQELPAETVRTGSELQLAFDTERDARYLVDFALDSAEQNFAVVTGDARTDQAPSNGHLALVVTGTGRRLTVRALPLGDEKHQTRDFTLFEVTVTPIG